MRMIRRSHKDSIDFTGHFIEHLAKIRETRQIGIALKSLKGVLRTDIGIAKGDNFAEIIIRGEHLQIIPSLRPASYRSKTHL